jgi:non-canonical purine NTP pyrophosphatase (RdgB/HAM1 family)
LTFAFITGNLSKFEEARTVIPQLNMLRADIPEIQSDSPIDVIQAKFVEAEHRFGDRGMFMVEDTSLNMAALEGLPGPLVKWFVRAIGTEGLFRLAQAKACYEAEAICMIAYGGLGTQALVVEGRVQGRIVSPTGEAGFGWDALFRPDGYEQTFAEMDPSLKQQTSPRTNAIRQLAAVISSRPPITV